MTPVHPAAFIIGLVFTALNVTGAYAQRNFDNVTLETSHVAGNVHMIVGAGGNIGVSAGSDGLLLIDDQFAPLAEKIQAELKGLNSGDLQFVLNTHHHGDHTGSNPFFGKSAPILAHRNVRARLAESGSEAGLPVLTYRDGITLYFNGEEIEVHHLGPAHTDGDSVVYFKGSGVAHLGDLFFNGRFPYIDLGGGGDVQGYMESVERILSYLPSDTRLIPGHGPQGDIADLQKFHGMLKETTSRIRDQIEAGKSYDQIAGQGLPDKWNEWGQGFINTERWIQIVYQSYSR